MTATTRTVPHSLEAEESLLGAMLLSRDAVGVAVEVCEAEDFYRPVHGNVFEAIVGLWSRNEPADPVTVYDTLAVAGLADQIGGAAGLLSLQIRTPASSNAGRYAQTVAEHAMMRRLIGVGGEIAELGYSSDPQEAAAAVDAAEQLVMAIADQRQTDTTQPISVVMKEACDRIDDLATNGRRITGVATGFVDLDDELLGLQPGSLNIVGARPSMGKTSLALSFALHASVHADVPTMIFSLEMYRQELATRMLAIEGKIDYRALRNGTLTQADWGKFPDTAARVAGAPLFIDDDRNVSIMDIRSRARRVKSKAGGLGLVVIDYLQLMRSRVKVENRQLEVSEISRGLKVLAGELGCPVVALSQLSRDLERRADKRPMLADLRESGSLEQDADVVMFIFRAEAYEPDVIEHKGKAEIIVAKHRNGPTGSVELAFHADYARFANLARREQW